MFQEKIMKKTGNNSGFTLIEMMIVIAIIGIVAAVSIPSYMSYRPRMNLKSLSRALVGNMQYAKIQTIRDNSSWSVDFDTGGGKYEMKRPGGTVYRTVSLGDYPGISYGSNNVGGPGSAGSPPADGVSFGGNGVTFNTNGSANAGTVYFKNNDGDSFAVVVATTGRVKAWFDFGGGWKE